MSERRPHPVILWIVLSVFLSVVDYSTSAVVQFPFFFIIPIALASWYNGKVWGLSLAVILSLMRMFFHLSGWEVPWSFNDTLINTFIRLFIFCSFAYVIDRTAQQHRLLSRKVDLLEGILPICASCKRIRDEQQEWVQVESYIASHSQANFSHGICPDCMKRDFPEVFRKRFGG